VKNEKRELVKRILRDGKENAFWRAAEALYDYMVEKDSNMPRTWCVRYVCNVAVEIMAEDFTENEEMNDGTD
jgi:hypothetical protein